MNQETSRTPKHHQGCLISNGVKLTKHEITTIDFLLNRGKDIELIRPSSKPYSKNADIRMNRLIWEMKSPCGKGKYIIRDTIRVATQQSPNLILDLRRIKLNKAKAHHDAEVYFQKSTARRMLIIVDNQLFDYTK